jgi:hypothetical protein
MPDRTRLLRLGASKLTPRVSASEAFVETQAAVAMAVDMLAHKLVGRRLPAPGLIGQDA